MLHIGKLGNNQELTQIKPQDRKRSRNAHIQSASHLVTEDDMNCTRTFFQ